MLSIKLIEGHATKQRVFPEMHQNIILLHQHKWGNFLCGITNNTQKSVCKCFLHLVLVYVVFHADGSMKDRQLRIPSIQTNYKCAANQ